MSRFVIHHRHRPDECAVAFAAWRGFASPLRGGTAIGSCRFGGHELWWETSATTEEEALALLPRYVAERSIAIRVDELEIP
jgi:hypothetical protein